MECSRCQCCLFPARILPIRFIDTTLLLAFSINLLFNPGAVPRYGAFYGQGSGPIFLADLQCIGTEQSLLDCDANVYAFSHCYHYEDVGVQCQGFNCVFVVNNSDLYLIFRLIPYNTKQIIRKSSWW